MTPCEMKENDISHNQLHSVGMIILKKKTRKQHMTVFLIIPDVTGICEK